MIFALIVIIIFFRIGYKINQVCNLNKEENEWKNKKIEVEIIDIYDQKEESITYECKIDNSKYLIQIKDVDTVYNYKDKLILLASKYTTVKANNPYEFNYDRFLNSKGYIAKIYSSKVLKVENDNKGFFSLAFNVRELINKNLEKRIGDYYTNILTSILYGDDLSLDESIKEKFCNIGIGHFLCVSGSHVVFLLSVFEYLTKDKRKSILSFILLLYFFYITLFSVSLLRVVIMYFLNLLFPKLSYTKKFLITLILVICINPYYIFSFGIIFSFLSTLGIHMFSNVIKSYFTVKVLSFKKCSKVGIIWGYVIESVAQTISAQILIIPFEIACFGKISLIAILSNLLLASVLNLVMLSGFFMFLLIFIPGLSNILITISFLFIHLLLELTNILDRINYFNIYIPRFSLFEYIIYYVFILLIVFKDKIWMMLWPKRKVVKNGILWIQSGVVIYFCIWYLYIIYLESYVIFFNVGQGNMALIHKGKTDIMVDMGSTQENNAENILSTYLKAKCIKDIECIYITHMHSDHMNGVIDILEKGNTKIKRVAYSIPYKEVEEYLTLKNVMKERNVAEIILKEKDELKIENTDILVITNNGEYIKDDDMLNANSTVFILKNKSGNIWFMGDSTKKTEQYILESADELNNHFNMDIFENIKCIQIAHHGSSTSSLDLFISNFNNKLGIISAKKKVYGHPSESTIKTLEKYNLKYYITENDGAIKISLSH